MRIVNEKFNYGNNANNNNNATSIIPGTSIRMDEEEGDESLEFDVNNSIQYKNRNM